MKNNIVKMAFAVSMGVLALGVAPSFADKAAPNQGEQSRDAVSSREVGVAGVVWSEGEETYVVKVPFMFAAGNSVLPAGSYTVKHESDDLAVLRITSTDGRHSAFITTSPGSGVSKGQAPVFSFREYNGADVLTAVAMPGEVVKTIPISRKALEQDLARLAAVRTKTEHQG